MADVDVSTGQSVVIEFLAAEGSMPIDVYKRLRIVYGVEAQLHSG